jgi:hypothetical protein
MIKKFGLKKLLLQYIMSFFTILFHYVLLCCQKYGIDESHGLPHAMNILLYANHIYEEEVIQHPIIKEHEKIIYVSAILHDMCDKKYMNEADGLKEIQTYLQYTVPFENQLTPKEMESVSKIISTMSYTKVKRVGFSNLGEYQRSYHIVREADLLCAYDFDRCMIYNMKTSGTDIKDAFQNAEDLFQSRVLQHINDNLFFTRYSIREAPTLHTGALYRIQHWRHILTKKIG